MVVDWNIGPVSEGASVALASIVALYTIGVGYYAGRAFQNHLEDRWSAALATVVMALLAWALFVQGDSLLPAPFSIFVLLAAAAGILITITYTLGRYKDKIDAFRQEFGGRLNALLEDVVPENRLVEFRRLQERLRPDKEMFRKTPHLMMGVFFLFYGVAGYAVFRTLWVVAYGGSPGSGEGAANLYAASHAAEGTYLVAGHMFSVMLLFSLFVLILPNELLRLRYPELSYPFKQTILRSLRKKEEGLFGAHLYITATLPLAVLWLTQDVSQWHLTIYAVMAMLAVTIFADASSALFGRRWGKRKWFHNPDKSYLGTFAGGLTALLVALPFVGVPLALVSVAVFVLVDILAPVPFPASDNLLNPLALAAAFTIGLPWLAPLLPFY